MRPSQEKIGSIMNNSHIRLPSLKGLKAFETAARLGSFTAAAKELFVTQGAVSHMIQAVEEDLGLRLFHRQGRRLILTEEGKRYSLVLSDAFSMIQQATRDIRDQQLGQSLTVSMPTSFATKWFAPRLASFLEANPEIDLRIRASNTPSSFDDGVDLAVRYGLGGWKGCHEEILFRDRVFPVCSPSFAETHGPFEDTSQLERLPLLYGIGTMDWREWLDLNGLRKISPQPGPSFDEGNALMQAVIDGIGLSLGRSSLVEGDLKTGRLLRVFDKSLLSSKAYYLVWPEWRATSRHFTVFRDWILSEIQKSELSVVEHLSLHHMS
ncbi:transcriptional regulator GcvA [Kiloniella sp. b19]|uniref:transcriptional regulator GcvA n=1 Tax=Kiloniella sp. GXU_MW_B19 TaxID=3141326 RepID=UPI0031CFCE47